MIVTIITIRGHLERMSQDGRLAFVSRTLGSALSSHLHIEHDSYMIHDDDCDENDDSWW